MTQINRVLPLSSRANLMKWLEFIVIASSSILLSIWAMKNTIALRNTSLVFGALCSLVYWRQSFKAGLFSKKQLPLFYWIPLALLGCLFIWVLLQNAFLSTNKAMQWHELTSTWLRSLLALILGSATALVLRHKPGMIVWIALGLLANFGAVFIQYLPSAIFEGRLYQTWSVLENILGGKVYGALLGTLYLSGLLGMLADGLRHQYSFRAPQIIAALASVVFILYCYVFVLDTRNGLALAMILSLTWISFQIYSFSSRKSTINPKQLKLMLMMCAGFLCLIFFFGYQQFKHNPYWTNFIEDVSISAKIDQHSAWLDVNPAPEAYPVAADGHSVSPSTYLRVSWLVAGTSIVPNFPLGVGVLNHSFGVAIQSAYPNARLTTSHCAWIDYALALGFPGIFFMLGSLFSSFLLTFFAPSYFSSTVRWLVVSLLLMYSLGELFNQAAVEILIYWMGLVAALVLPNSPSTLLRSSEER